MQPSLISHTRQQQEHSAVTMRHDPENSRDVCCKGLNQGSLRDKRERDHKDQCEKDKQNVD